MLHLYRPGHHKTGEVGHGAHGDCYANVQDVLGQDSQRLHPGPILPSPGQPLPPREQPVS